MTSKAQSDLAAAQLSYQKGRNEDALVEADRAAAEFEKAGDGPRRIAALNVAGRALRKMARYDEARLRHQSALDLARRASDRTLEAGGLIDLGEVYERQKDHPAALAAFEAALRLLELPRDQAIAGRAQVQVGDIQVERGAFDEALRAYTSALTGAQQAGNVPGIALYQDYTGYFFRRLGDYATAIDYHENALRTADKLSGTARNASVARSHNHLGLCHLALAEAARNAGDLKLARIEYDRAIEHEQTALKAAEAAEELWRQGYVLRALSSTHRALAELESGDQRLALLRQSRERGQQALKLGTDAKEWEWQNLARHELAVTEARLGDVQAARVRLGEAIAAWSGAKDLKSLGFAHMLLAREVFERDGGTEPAIAEYRKALAAFEALRATEDQATAWYRIGSLQERANRLDDAEKSYLKSIEALEDIRSKLTRQEHKLNFFSGRLKSYDALIKLLLRRHRQTADLKYAEAAFLLAERSRSQTLLDLLQGATDRFKAGVPAEVTQQEKSFRARFYALSAELANSRGETQAAALREKIDSLSLAYAQFEHGLRSTFPAYAELKSPPILPAAAVASRVLQPGELLLEYYVSVDDTHIFVVDTKGLRKVVSLGVGSRELLDNIVSLRRPFEKLKDDGTIAPLHGFDAALAKRLHDRLVQPVAADIHEARRLLIVPHGPLYYLPFEMLAVGPRPATAAGTRPPARLSEFEDVTWFIETAPPIAYALSASLLNPDLAQRGDGQNGGSGGSSGGGTSGGPGGRFRPLLAFGNPLPGESDDRADPLVIRGNTLTLSALPQSEIEVKKVAALFGRDSTVFLGGKATKQRFLSEAPHHRVLLLSTHGVLDEDYPMMSGLVFAPQSGKEPQLLHTFEIFDLALNSDFVVLSACEIGLGPLREGEGLLGIGRAFFYAGAGSLALTLWSVDDQASSDLVTGMFTSRERAGRDDAAALRESKLAFIGARRASENGQLATSHPFFWAPFVVVEGPRRRR